VETALGTCLVHMRVDDMIIVAKIRLRNWGMKKVCSYGESSVDLRKQGRISFDCEGFPGNLDSAV
jgi:hypothetical protein